MKLLKYCLITLLLLFTLSLFAQNYMDTMNTFEGPWGNSKYGEYMATLDFNADGIDDLFVLARNGPSSISEVHVFWGGNNFGYNNTPDYIIPMTGSNGSHGVFACGDVNGDGYEDIAIAGTIRFGNYNNPEFYFYRFYYGGPDAVLDFTDYDHEYGYLVGSGYYSDREWFTSCLGDVNGDGCDDMGFILQRESMSRDLAIMLGGTFEMIIVEDFIYSEFNIEPVGDLNYDGFADFAVGYLNFSNDNITKIYYGDSLLSLTEYEIICNYEQTYNFNGAITIGDMNGDGFPDFLYPITENNNSDNFGLAFWENSFENSISYPLQCSPVHSSFILGSFGFGQWIKYGDFNGDGYDDFVGGNPSYGLRDGTAAIWLGGENPNAVYDLRFVKPVYPTFTGYFGININVGDYNNDGFDDIALSAPYSYSGQGTPGYVSVYAGNPNLSDTTVSNDDNEVNVLPKTTLVIYPNPVSSKDIKLNLKLVGHLPKNIEKTTVSIYNLKGQKVDERNLNTTNIKNSSDAIKLESLASGLYIATIKINNIKFATSKFIVK